MNKNKFIMLNFFIGAAAFFVSGSTLATCDIPAESAVATTACVGSLNGSRECDLLRVQQRYCATLALDEAAPPVFYTGGPEIREQNAFCVKNTSSGTCYQLDQDIPESSLELTGTASTTLGNFPPIGVDQHGNVWSLNEGGATLGCLAADAGSTSSSRETHCGFLSGDAADQVVLFPPTLAAALDPYGKTSGKQNNAVVEPVQDENTDKTLVWFSQWSESAYLWTQPDRSTASEINTFIDNAVISYGGVSLPTKDVWCTRHQPQWINEDDMGIVDGACGLLKSYNGGYNAAQAFNPFGLSKVFALEIDHENEADPLWKVYYPAGLPNQDGLDPEVYPPTGLVGKKGDGLTNVHNVRRDDHGRTWFIAFSSEHLAQIGYFNPADFKDGSLKTMTSEAGDCQLLRVGSKSDLCLEYYEPFCDFDDDDEEDAYESCFHFFDLPSLPLASDFVIDEDGDIWFLSSFNSTIGLLDLTYDGSGNPIAESAEVKLYPLDRGFFNALIVSGVFETLGHENLEDWQVAEWMEIVDVEAQQYLSIQGASFHGWTGLFNINLAKAGSSCDVDTHAPAASDLYRDNPCYHVLFTQRSRPALTMSLQRTPDGDGFVGGMATAATGSLVIIPKDTIDGDLGAVDNEIDVKNYSSWLSDDPAFRKAHEYFLGTTLTSDNDGFNIYTSNPVTGDLWGSGGFSFVKYKKMEADELILDAYADTGEHSNGVPVSRMALRSKGDCLGAKTAELQKCYVLLADNEDDFGVRVMMDASDDLTVTIKLESCDPDCSEAERTDVGSSWVIDVDDPYSLCNVLEPGTCDSASSATAHRPGGAGLYLYTITNNLELDEEDNPVPHYLFVKVGLDYDNNYVIDDLDGDGLKDENEFAPWGRFPSDFTMADSDDDDVWDAIDQFPRDERESLDTDEDSLGNEIDDDDDNDGLTDDLDIDDDGDGDNDTSDNCPAVPNASQTDTDGDLVGDACDYDGDGDSVADLGDAFPLNIAASVDTDGDGHPDSWNIACDSTCQSSSGLTLDLDDDNDGFSDTDESAIGSNSLNLFDPVFVSVSNNVLSAMDWEIYPFGSYYVKAWNAVDGVGIYQELGDGSFIGLEQTGYDVFSLDMTGVTSLWLQGKIIAINDSVRMRVGHHLDDTGGSHICVLTSTPEVWCGYGDLSDPSNTSARQLISSLTDPSDIAVGAGFACAIVYDSTDDRDEVTCWDYYSGSNTVPTPSLLSGTEAVAISAGLDHVCAITKLTSGTVATGVQCWGNDIFNQLGDANSDGYADGVTAPLNIDTGDNHTCIVNGTYAGSTAVVCWGAGAENYPSSAMLGDLADLSAEKPVSIKAGGDNNCAVLAGFTSADEALVCWSIDTDNDDIGNNIDTDDDADGVSDDEDAFRLNIAASIDTDGDGQPDSWNGSCDGTCQSNSGLTLDMDDDGDACPDTTDPHPLSIEPGDLDCTFSTDGVVTNGFVTGHDGAYASLIWNVTGDTTNNGKLVAAGKIYNTSTYGDVGVARYNLDGTLDSSFGTGGYVTTAIGPHWDVALSVAQQADGKIVVAGYRGSSSVSDAMIVVRYNTDGTLDDEFGVDSDGVDGVVIVDNDLLDMADYAQANDVIIQTDGKIVVVGLAKTQDPEGPLPSALDGVIFRLNEDGSFDADDVEYTGFSGDGIVVQKLSDYNDAYYSVLQQEGGKLVAAGRHGADFAVVRYNTDGTLDTGFSGDGKINIDFGGQSDYAYSLVEQEQEDEEEDPKLVVVGVSGAIDGSGQWTGQDIAVMRLLSDGSLDTSSFGDSGKQIIDGGFDFAAGWNVKVQPDRELVIVGHASDSFAARDIAVVRLEPDGALDTGFGTAGMTTLDIGGDDQGRSVEFTVDNKLWVLGYGRNGTYDDFVLLRYHD